MRVGSTIACEWLPGTQRCTVYSYNPMISRIYFQYLSGFISILMKKASVYSQMRVEKGAHNYTFGEAIL